MIVYSASTFFTGKFRKTSWIVHVVALFFLASFLLDDYMRIKGGIASGAYSEQCGNLGGLMDWLKCKCATAGL
jgi:hypothetical protein